MLNAEDTKERIRKLRLKVISEPADTSFAENINQNIADRFKSLKEWKDTPDSETVNSELLISKDTFLNEQTRKEDLPSKNNLEKFENQKIKYESLNNKNFSQSNIQNEIDKRVKNNSQMIVELFNERVESLKNQIVNSDNFEKFRSHIIEQLETSIFDLTDKLNEKLTQIHQQTSDKDAELDNRINEKTTNLGKIIQEKMNLVSQQLSYYENKYPNELKNLEEKIYSDINQLVNEFGSQIKTETDKFSLSNEIIKSDLFKSIENFEEKIDNKFTDAISKSNSSLEEHDLQTEKKLNLLYSDIDKNNSENLNQFSLFKDSQDILKRDLEDFKDSMSLKSNALASEISFQIKDFDSKFIQQLSDFNKEIENVKKSLNLQNENLITDFDKKIENAESSNASIISQIQHDNNVLKTTLNKNISSLEDNAYKQINSLKDELLEKIEKNIISIDNVKSRLGEKVEDNIKSLDIVKSGLEQKIESSINSVDTIKIELDQKIDENNKNSLDKIYQLNGEFQIGYNAFKEDLKTSNLLSFRELKEDLKTSKAFSNDIFDKTNLSISKLKQNINEGQQTLISEINKKENELRDLISKNLNEVKIHYNKILTKVESDNEIKMNKFLASFNTEILQNNNSNEIKFDNLTENIKELKSNFDKNFALLTNSLNSTNTTILNNRKELIDNQKELEINFSQAQKNIIGIVKEKYKTLKSKIWEEFSIIKKVDNEKIDKIKLIEKEMITFPTLKKNIRSELHNENNKLVEKLKVEINKINQVIKKLDGRILNEKELTEIFQNHSLNVNISQNNKLLSKVKKEFEKQRFWTKFSLNRKKIIASVILIGSIASIIKIIL